MTRSISRPGESSKSIVSSFVENLALLLSDKENMAMGEDLGEKHCGSTGIKDDELTGQNCADTTPEVKSQDSVWKTSWEAAPEGEESFLHEASASESGNFHVPYTISAVASIPASTDGIDLTLSEPQRGNSTGISLPDQSHPLLISSNKKASDLPFRSRSLSGSPRNPSTANGPSSYSLTQTDGTTSERGTRIMEDSINPTILEDVVNAKDETSSDSTSGLAYVNSVCQ